MHTVVSYASPPQLSQNSLQIQYYIQSIKKISIMTAAGGFTPIFHRIT
jgi:hypothetical protein